MQGDLSPESPERRAEHGNVHALGRLGPGARAWEIVKRIAIGVYSDGFIHAGNLAFLALMTLFPFCIVTAALAHFLGRGPETMDAVASYLRELPPSVRQVVKEPIADVLAQRTGALLWLGGLVGLWTTASFIETIRDILRRSYGVSYVRSFWEYRLNSGALVVASVLLTLAAFSAELLLSAVAEVVQRLLPFASGVLTWIGWTRAAPPVSLFVALYLLFYSLTPGKYRRSNCPKWPGALVTAFWWVTVATLLPRVLALLGGYGRTYGSLAGVVVTLIFFWLVGFGLVIGAQLNAALAEPPETSVREPEQPASMED